MVSPLLSVLQSCSVRLFVGVVFAVSWLTASAAFGGQVHLPSNVLDSDAPVRAFYKTNLPVTGKGELSIRWTDVLGRVVEERKIPFMLTDEYEVGFDLDLRRAVSMKNELSVHFSIDGENQKGEPDRREEDATISFVARTLDRNWSDYEIIMWHEHGLEANAVLKEVGISAGRHGGRSESTGPDRLPAALLDNDQRWYEENIATDFYFRISSLVSGPSGELEVRRCQGIIQTGPIEQGSVQASSQPLRSGLASEGP